MNRINFFQKKLLIKCANYLSKLKKSKIDISLSPLCFFTIWASSPGHIKVNSFAGKNASFNFFFIFKNILSIMKNHDLNLHYKKQLNFKKLKKMNLIISYSSKGNFDSSGHFHDNFFNTNNRKNKNLVWFLISIDNFVPKNLKNNIILVAKNKNNSVSFFYFIKSIIKLILYTKFSLSKFYHYCWFEYNYSLVISNLFKDFFNGCNIRNVIINYEGIPFQHFLLKTIKELNLRTKTYGYLHCAPWPLQVDLFYKKNLLDKLIVSGIDQKKILEKELGWKKNLISVIPSLRFDKKNKKEFSGYIFVPYNLKKNNNYLIRFEEFLKNLPSKCINKLQVRIHPLNKSSGLHQRFSIDAKKIIKKYKQKFSSKNESLSFFFGSATGVCIQALEEGTKIIHFPENQLLDVFSQKIWKNIKIHKLGDNIFSYKILKRGRIFHVNHEKNKFNKYLLPLIKT